jgi:hypothetical protein
MLRIFLFVLIAVAVAVAVVVPPAPVVAETPVATPEPTVLTIGARSANVHQEDNRVVMAFDDQRMTYTYTRNGGYLSGGIGAGGEDLEFAMLLVSEWEALGGGQPEASHRSGLPMIAGVLFVGLGVLLYVMPQRAWQLSTGRRSSGDLPTPRALLLYRSAGALVAIVGLFLLVP